jgi:succinyl-diaminopimelate desuccinylase
VPRSVRWCNQLNGIANSVESSETREIISRISEYETFLTGITTQLAAVPTVTVRPFEDRWLDCSQYTKAADILQSQLASLGISSTRLTAPDSLVEDFYGEKHPPLPMPNVVASFGDSPEEGVHLTGHYDTVPPATSGWRRLPFEPTMSDGKIYGLGTSDMKGGVACILGVLKVFRDLRIKPKSGLTVSFTCDEEIGGKVGVAWLVKEKQTTARHAIIAEPTQPDMVKHGIKGALWLSITAEGRQAHGSRPHLGVNAFDKIVDIAMSLRNLENGLFGSQKTSYHTEDEPSAHTTLMLGGRVSGGSKGSSVPDSCTMTVDCRFIPEMRLDAVENEIRLCLSDLQRKDPDLRFQVLRDGADEPVVVSPDALVCQKLAASHVHVTGKTAKLVISSDANDSGFLVQSGIPTAVYGPGLSEQAHRADEFVQIRDLVSTTQALALTVYGLTVNDEL